MLKMNIRASQTKLTMPAAFCRVPGYVYVYGSGDQPALASPTNARTAPTLVDSIFASSLAEAAIADVSQACEPPQTTIGGQSIASGLRTRLL